MEDIKKPEFFYKNIKTKEIITSEEMAEIMFLKSKNAGRIILDYEDEWEQIEKGSITQEEMKKNKKFNRLIIDWDEIFKFYNMN